ncbi:hypothetical protein HDU93_004617 [Gonapodya sp. JEL0774]|nr:hypothetical protein HDU93_004617 [Gonapodya sp. JEL0774]
MPSLAHIAGATGTLDLTGRNALVVGGTQGIGAAVALLLYSRGSNVIIAGRNPERAANVIRLAEITSTKSSTSPHIAFLPTDTSLLSECRTLADKVPQANGGSVERDGLHYMVLCAGGLAIRGPKMTAEGNESSFMTNVGSRFALPHLLFPYLRRATPPGVILNVSGAGNGFKAPDVTDLQLKKSGAFGTLAAANVASQVNDVVAVEWARRQGKDGVRYIHAFPGFITTDSPTNIGLPFPLPQLYNLARPFLPYIPLLGATTPEIYAKSVVYVLTSSPSDIPNGALIQGPTAEKVEGAKWQKGLKEQGQQGEDVMKGVWEYMRGVAGVGELGTDGVKL